VLVGTGPNAKARRGFPSGLGHNSEGYPFMSEARFNVYRFKVVKFVERGGMEAGPDGAVI
jgi:hypothetical protein